MHSLSGLSCLTRRFWALLAALLVCWAAVHPALLNAAGGSQGERQGAAWLLLCTAQGMEWVRVEGGSAPGFASDSAPDFASDAATGEPQPPAKASLKACPWCTFAQHLLLPALPAPQQLAGAQRARLVRVLALPTARARVEAARHLRALPGRGPPHGWR